MNKLIIMVGAPGSGKTTWAEKYAKDHLGTVVISRDKIRFSLLKDGEQYFSKEDEVLRKFYRNIFDELRFGHNVIADASHLTWKARKELLSHITERAVNCNLPETEVCVVVVRPPLEVCYQRNDLRTGRALVPHNVIKRMYNSYTDPINDYYIYDDITYITE